MKDPPRRSKLVHLPIRSGSTRSMILYTVISPSVYENIQTVGILSSFYMMALSDDQPEYPFIGFTGLWLFVSVVSNFGVLVVILYHKKTQSVTSIFMCNLALSDIFLAAFVIPQSVHDLSHQEDYHEGVLACKLINFLPVLCITGSVYTLVAMSHERCRAIVYHTKVQISVPKSKIGCICIWFFSFLISVPSIIEYKVYALPDLTNSTAEDAHQTQSPYTEDPHHDDHHHDILRCGSQGIDRNFVVANGIFLLFTSYIFPMLVMFYNYGKLVHFIFKQSSRVEPSDAGPTATKVVGSRTLSKRRMKIVKMLIIVTLLFCICWAPYFSILIMAKIRGKDDSSEADSLLNKFRLCLTIFSTSYNFVTYFKYNESFRAGFLNLFCRCITKKVPEPSLTNTQGGARQQSSVAGTTAKIRGKDDSSEADSLLNKFRLCLTIFSASYNFVTYFKYNESFRAGFLNLFCRCITKKVPEPSLTNTQGGARQQSSVAGTTAVNN
ncbi:hypothetical protein CAPTEDRAFT_217182 [Capitella teleta]|uniref:G-protein coupled receptors family 1 profile domain-containing protein n=1 Tax=Capitella teleta TaxID=283909 RepID=R7U101_CAPTE|nr:hypothetical protein CAPTEDRAFT_217182 [Capitella teleta]|eukprot:ELT99684.1 hypothetical protein CAPTEDRAFT_217182 [Capitella teleta]